jgi:hypothetical protein
MRAGMWFFIAFISIFYFVGFALLGYSGSLGIQGVHPYMGVD